MHIDTYKYFPVFIKSNNHIYIVGRRIVIELLLTELDVFIYKKNKIHLIDL